jgi:hypothetical protein
MAARALTLMAAKVLPWVTRYFVISNVEVDKIELGLATLIRMRGWKCSYLYFSGTMEGNIERIPETPFYWGSWVSVDMRKSAYVVREIDEQDSFVMIRRACAAQKPD